MLIAVKEIIEKYIHIIEQDNIEMLLYLTYRDGHNNFDVYHLRAALADANVCTMEQSKVAAEKLFMDAFLDYMKREKLTYIKSLDEFIYGSPTVKRAFTNVFGLEFQDVIDLLNKNSAKYNISVKEDTHRFDAEVRIGK